MGMPEDPSGRPSDPARVPANTRIIRNSAFTTSSPNCHSSKVLV